MKTINEIELLAPAGSFDALVAAIQNGANAIYVGGKKFGARAFAHNFDNEELKKAVEYCHLRNVSLYVTVNTIYKDEDFDDLIEYILELYKMNVDAFIVQDMGLYHLIKNHLPDVEIHMSTQSSVRNIEGVRFFEEEGIDRVVLAREMTIQEISEICHNCNIDIEVFVHGALCMSYSGQCLMSSMIAKRSGNKGECGQPCRLPYDLIEDGKFVRGKDKYLLSPQDLCTIEHVGELIESGIKSFKIEGRMKRPEYVGEVIRSYRRAIDHYYESKKINLDKSILNMKKMFNRGFQSGFIFNESLKLAKDIPGNRGVKVGKINRYIKDKKLLEIKLCDELCQNDRIYFSKEDLTRTITKLYMKNRLVSKGCAGDVVCIELDKKVNLNQDIFKIYDYHLIQEHSQYLKTEHIKSPIDMKVYGDINTPLTLTVFYKGLKYTTKSESFVEEALNTPLTHERITQQLSKLGSTLYYLNHIDIHFPNHGIFPIKELNALRRDAIEGLEKRVLESKRDASINVESKEGRNDKHVSKLFVQLHSFDQLDDIDMSLVDEVYVPFYEYKPLEGVYPYVPFLYDESDLLDFISSDLYKDVSKIMVSDFGAYHLTRNKKQILSQNFNISNSYALKQMDLDTVLTYEMSKKDINHLEAHKEIYFKAYSKIVNMNMKHCIISDYHFDTKHKHCNRCKKHNYMLNDRMNKKFEIVTDPYCNNYILHSHRLFVDKLQGLKVDGIFVSFINESSKEINDIVCHYHKIIHGISSEYVPEFDRFSGYY